MTPDAYAIRATRDASHDDSWWACDVELREDGAGIVVPLTLARLDSWAREFDQAPLGPRCRAHFSMPPQ